MAGYIPIIQVHKREDTVRPPMKFIKEDLNLLHEESGDVGAEKVHPSDEEQKHWEEASQKIEDLETKMAQDRGRQRQFSLARRTSGLN